jgi:hypothetical protein
VAGRKKPIDADLVEKVARLGCTLEEIGDIVGCSVDTLERRFADTIARARAHRKMSLRRAQTVRAIRDRSDAMLIHLGKHELGQRDDGEGGALREVLAGLLGGRDDRGGAGEVPR